MTAAAQTSEPTNPPTGVERLLDVARWLVFLLIIHWIVARGRELADALDWATGGPSDTFLARSFGTTDRAVVLTRITHILRRAAALQAELLARRPTEQGFPIEARRAIGAQIIDIGRDLGIFRRKSTATLARNAQPRFFAWTFGVPAIAAAPAAIPQLAFSLLRILATGPPQRTPSPRVSAGA